MPAVRNNNGRCLIRFTYKAQSYSLTIGSFANQSDRIKAEQIARQIWLDAQANNFDAALKRYKPEQANDSLESKLERKLANQYDCSVDALLKLIKRYGGISNSADKFFAWLEHDRELAPSTLKRYYAVLHLLEPKLCKSVKLPKCSRTLPQPFSKTEVRSILSIFADSHYYAYVLALLSTGLRTAEAIGLRWQNMNFGDRTIRVCESLARHRGSTSQRQYKSTKTGKVRIVPISNKLHEALADLAKSSATELVFVSPKGKPIDDHNFSQRVWRKALAKADVAYRSPYNCRHTFISNCLASGIPVSAVAEWAGNSPEIIWRHYAGAVRAYDVPELEI